jgi:hypothetical protein
MSSEQEYLTRDEDLVAVREREREWLLAEPRPGSAADAFVDLTKVAAEHPHDEGVQAAVRRAVDAETRISWLCKYGATIHPDTPTPYEGDPAGV